jgi:hypothetical protein
MRLFWAGSCHISRLCLFAGSLILLTLTTSAVAAPVAVCVAPALEFGTQTDDVVVRHLFQVENRGDAPLVLRTGRACCGATVTVPEQPVAPGSNAILRVELKLRGRSGKVAKAVYIQTNDPKQAVLRLELNGRVVAIPGPPPS